MKRSAAPRRALLAASLAALLAGCASGPPVRLYTLVSAADAAEPAPAAAALASAPPLPVNLRVASVPLQVDQPQWLVRLPDDTLQLLEQERWAAPLRDELRAALLQVLAARFGVVDAREAGAARDAAWRVRIDVTRFESLPGREARLEVGWVLQAPGVDTPRLTCRAAIREPVGAGAPALAEGHRRAAAVLADAIGRALRSGSLTACPGDA